MPSPHTPSPCPTAAKSIEAGDIHVAGHSAGGQGIIAATRTGAISDQIRDITPQDAGYSFGWDNIMDWLLSRPPEKTSGY
jgi:hypothetical protein